MAARLIRLVQWDFGGVSYAQDKANALEDLRSLVCALDDIVGHAADLSNMHV